MPSSLETKRGESRAGIQHGWQGRKTTQKYNLNETACWGEGGVVLLSEAEQRFSRQVCLLRAGRLDFNRRRWGRRRKLAWGKAWILQRAGRAGWWGGHRQDATFMRPSSARVSGDALGQPMLPLAEDGGVSASLPPPLCSSLSWDQDAPSLITVSFDQPWLLSHLCS